MLFRSILVGLPDQETIEALEYRPSDEEIKLRRSLIMNDKNKEKKKEKKEESKVSEKDNEDSEDEVEDDYEEKAKNKKMIEEALNDAQDTQSSITSGNTGSTRRSFYSLRPAIDEKYVPVSRRQMGYAAVFVF